MTDRVKSSHGHRYDPEDERREIPRHDCPETTDGSAGHYETHCPTER